MGKRPRPTIGASLQMCSAPSDRAGGLHAGIGLGEGTGREPGRLRARALLHAAAAREELRRAERPGWSSSCISYARAHPPSGAMRERTIWETVRGGAERSLVAHAGPFDGFHALPASVSKTCLVRFDSNQATQCSAHAPSGRPVEIQAYADRVVELRQNGRVRRRAWSRSFGRGRRPCLRSLALRADPRP